VIDSLLGPIEILLELGRAPLSAGDFLKYVDRGLYAGGAFYRTVRPDDDTNPIKIDVVQGGLTDDGKYLDPIPHEPTSFTGLRHRDGTISIARDAVGTGTAGAFFVCIGDQPALDFGGKRNPDGQGFAAFGQVTNGMKLIREIWSSKTQGPPGSLEGELIASPVQILGARRVNQPSAVGKAFMNGMAAILLSAVAVATTGIARAEVSEPDSLARPCAAHGDRPRFVGHRPYLRQIGRRHRVRHDLRPGRRRLPADRA
jgi:peptidyl-prolyl cis-trans isomerase A (cyclophilin A)